MYESGFLYYYVCGSTRVCNAVSPMLYNWIIFTVDLQYQ